MSGEVKLVRRFKTTLDTFPIGYISSSFYIVGDTIFVLNGANVGNAVLQFDLEGNYLGEMPGWYNFPDDLIVGGPSNDQVLASAIGAMGDNNMLRFGLVMYNSSGEFFHGFHEVDTDLVRPYGLVKDPLSSMVGVCDWDGNRTVLLNVDWEEGSVEQAEEIASVAYPTRMALTRSRVVIASDVCCEPWHEAMRVVTFYSRESSPPDLLATVKKLPTGETIQIPRDVALTEDEELVLLSDEGLNKTIMLDMEGNYLGEVTGGLGAPRQIQFHAGLLYSLTNEDNPDLGILDGFINVFSYSW